MKNKKTQIKTVKPTQKGKKRYLSFMIISPSIFQKKDVENALWNTYLELYGSYLCSLMRPWLVSWDEKQGKGIIRYSLSKDIEARAGILFLREIAGKKVAVKIGKVSGAICNLK